LSVDYPSGTHAQFLSLFSNAAASIIDNILLAYNYLRASPNFSEIIQEDSAHRYSSGSDFEGNVNLFTMMANWDKKKPSDASYEMSCMQPGFFVRGENSGRYCDTLKPKKRTYLTC